MKIRTNYVSNSSSSSFCILGVNLINFFPEIEKGEKDIDDIINDIERKMRLRNSISSDRSKISIEHGLGDYYEEDYFIGVSPEHMKEEETLKEFKERICSELNGYGISCKTTDLYFYIDGGYDG